MGYFHVLLNGTGTSGDGSTWNDLSQGDSAYIADAGLVAALTAASPVDFIFCKGRSAGSATTVSWPSTASLALSRQPYRIFGCKSATTNLGVNIDTNDLIPGFATGGTTPAYDDADIPLTKTTGASASFFLYSSSHVYGMEFECSDDLRWLGGNHRMVGEECLFQVTGSGDRMRIGDGQRLDHFIHCKWIIGGDWITAGGVVELHGGEIIKTSGSIFDNVMQRVDIRGVDISTVGNDTNLTDLSVTLGSVTPFSSCKLISGWALTTGVSPGAHEVINHASDSNTGLSASEQFIETLTHHGTVTTETTKVRTGGADDGSSGSFSYNMTGVANGTLDGSVGLWSPWMKTPVTGDGTSKTLTVYLTSDDGNTNGSDWQDDELWLEAFYPSEDGDNADEFKTTRASLLAAGSNVTDDVGSTWAAGTQNDQKLQMTIAPDYPGVLMCRVVFCSGANADTIYIDPKPAVA